MKLIFKTSFVFVLTTLILFSKGFTAEEEYTLLTISGDLIGELDSTVNSDNPNTIIAAYYTQLEDESRAELVALRRRMDRRLEDYQVAYTAADTAEINEILDDLSFYWASMRTIHAQEYSEGAISQLHAAFGQLYEFIGGTE